jgi:hypothetical protein
MLGLKHEGNTEEENNGNVVFKCNIHGSATKYRVVAGRGGGVTPPAPTCFFKDDVNGFPSVSDICFMN